MRKFSHCAGRIAVAGSGLIIVFAIACNLMGTPAGGNDVSWLGTPSTATSLLAATYLGSTAAYTLLTRPFREHDLEGYYHALFSTPDHR